MPDILLTIISSSAAFILGRYTVKRHGPREEAMAIMRNLENIASALDETDRQNFGELINKANEVNFKSLLQKISTRIL